ncbi:HNH endonuclease [Aphanizomenon sp. UHCC 0183]|jgi:hypothetical protein|uniref:HNH endonuclease n=1 Tax=Aphanizomenon sp. UHCC 0183 TaxID=2590028 RepID=UPI001C2C8BBF|nr:HNH endonuclease [Aphanizomenon sp. UHCC 0183]
MRKTVFFNIGWMKHYQGITTDDDIEGGGEFIDDNKYGHEIFNFQAFNDYMYGYVQPGGTGNYLDRKINIDRLDAAKQNLVYDVLSVWVAPNPDKNGTWVIGWYENSTVYRNYQQAPPNSNRIFKDTHLGYRVTAKVKDCVCLPIEKRNLQVPRSQQIKGGIGQSNIWYADSEEKDIIEFRQKVENFIQEYRNSDIIKLINIRQELDQDFFNTNIINLEDARKRVLRSIVCRQGQSQFRQKLLTAYKGRCAISGCDVEPALEAAHIIPYLGLHSNITSNGLLLRADIHTLFDLNLITIHPDTIKVLVAPKLMKTQCRAFYQKTIILPENEADRPDKKAIKKHYTDCDRLWQS